MSVRCLICLLAVNLVMSAREPKQITLENQGTISGMYISRFRTKRIAAYVGIPYAQPPLQSLRLAPPEINSLPSWDGVRNATVFTPDCMQRDINSPQDTWRDIDMENKPNRHDQIFKKLLESQQEEKRKLDVSEDCLYLNVYVPDDPKVEDYPVMVWLHGGDFITGSPHDMNPFQLVLKQKVIFVSVAYRLNIFGFFSTLDHEAVGNFGLMDQEAALIWVKNNIAKFGGDPKNVCLFGQGAGAISIGVHLVRPESRKLFSKAITMSGNILGPKTVGLAMEEVGTVDKVSILFDCFRQPTYLLVQCLRGKPVQAMLSSGERATKWKPIVDSFNNVTTQFLPDLPSSLLENDEVTVPVLMGYTNMEDALVLDKNDTDDAGITQREFDMMREEVVSSDVLYGPCFENQHHIHDAVEFFYKPIPPTTNETVLRKLFLDFYTDKVYAATTYQLAKVLSKNAPVYVYRFDLKPFSDIANEDVPGWVSVPHNFDLIFTFGMPYLASPSDLTKWDYRDKSISEIIMKMWTNFAWYSNPTNSGVIIDWEPFQVESPGFLIIDRQNFTMSTSETINYKAFEFWTDFYPKLLKIGTKCCKEPTGDSEDSGVDSITTRCILSLVLSLYFILTIFS